MLKRLKPFCAGLVSIAALAALSAQAQVTWEVQSDYFGAQGGSISQARSLRGLALAPDENSLFTGFIQGSTSGGIREVSSSILTQTGSDSIVIGNGMGLGINANPNGNYASNPYYGVGVLASLQTGGGSSANNQPKGVATDSDGYVYATLNHGGANSVSHPWAIYAPGLSGVAGLYVSTAASASQLAGICVFEEDGSKYVYLSRNGPSAQIERWNVTDPAAAFLDTTWGGGTGMINLRTLNPAAYCNGLEADDDGTLYVAGGILSNTRGDSVFKIPAAAGISGNLSTVQRTNVAGAMDVALFQERICVSQYLANLSTVAVLTKTDLSLVETLSTGFAHTNTSVDTGYSGIDVAFDGRIFVADQLYKPTSSSYTPPSTSFNLSPSPINSASVMFDRVLVSSALEDHVAPIITCAEDVTVDADPGQVYASNVDIGTTTAVDDVDGPVDATGTRNDGEPLDAPYPVGTTIITWTAEDAAGNPAEPCEQIIMVIANNGPRLMKEYVLDQLQAFLPLSDKKDNDKLRAAINSLAKSLVSQYWNDDSHLVESSGTKVFDGEKDAAKKLRELSASNKSGLTSAQLDPLAADLVAADRTLATTAINEAIVANGNASKISKAQGYLAKGDAKAKADEAINDYKNAWKEAVAAF